MKKQLLAAMLLALIPGVAMGNDNTDEAQGGDKKFRLVPVVSSNPNAGTGVGFMSSFIYNADTQSSPSQLLGSAQYTNTSSWNISAMNSAFFHDDFIKSTTMLAYLHNNTEFFIDSMDSSFDPVQGDASYEVDVMFLGQQLLFEMWDQIFVGGQAMYTSQNFSNPNELGGDFLQTRGVKNASRGGFGLTVSYDTRSKAEKIYPRNAEYISGLVNFLPEFLGADTYFSTMVLNARHYQTGLREEDVWASQLFIKHCSADTPDGALAALGSQNVLRGFAIGQYKARTMAALQTEYRYQIRGTRFRMAGFIGLANLSGGSTGTAEGNRDSDNGTYASGGIGIRYMLQPKAGVDFRIDLATTSKDEQSVYARINQAF